MGPGQSIPVLPFFNLVMVWNPGVSYGLFPASSLWGTGAPGAGFPGGGGGPWLVAVGHDQPFPGDRRGTGDRRGHREQLIDRLVYGRVADFFHFYGFGYDWYVFNIADIAITLGAVAIIYEVLKPQPEA